MNEVLQQILQWTLPIGGGITVGAVLLLCAKAIAKSTVNKLLGKLNIKEIVSQLISETVEKSNTVVHEHNITPVVKSELAKVTEQANEYIRDEIGEMKAYSVLQLACIKALGSYFDDSIGVAEEKKQLFHATVEQAEKSFVSQAEPIVAQVVVEEKKTAQIENESPKTSVKVVR